MPRSHGSLGRPPFTWAWPSDRRSLPACDAAIALPALQGGLLLDGLYLATVVAFTGGAVSPLRFLLYAHVVAVTLLCSYRTGLKLALWDTLLFLLVVEAIAADLVPQLAPVSDESVTAAAVLTVAAIWVLAIGTAAFSAANERQLRRQKVGLAALSAMVARMDELDAADRAEEIPRILLAALGSTFGFTRGVVLSSSDGGRLEVLTATDVGSPRALPDGSDPAIMRAWDERAPQLVRTLDATDPCLDALLPEARNVAVVPLFHAGGRRLGVVAMERGAEVGGMRRWEVDLAAQFAAHAALALSNAWLTDERERQLATIRGLEVRLRAHNADLEATVADRTEELRRTIADLEEIDRQRRRLLHHVVRAAEDERTRIAHDVHDDPVQKLIAVKMRLEMLGSAHPELPEVMEAQATVASTIGSMRRMLFDLSPPILEEAGIGPALRYFLEHSPVTTEWSLDDQLRTQPSTQTRLILYRIAQEALTNARKHANAAQVKVTLQDGTRASGWRSRTTATGSTPRRRSRHPATWAWWRCESARRWPVDGASCRACRGRAPCCRCGCLMSGAALAGPATSWRRCRSPRHDKGCATAVREVSLQIRDDEEERRRCQLAMSAMTPEALISKPYELVPRNVTPDTIAGWKAVADGFLTNESCAFHRNVEISSRYAWIYKLLPRASSGPGWPRSHRITSGSPSFRSGWTPIALAMWTSRAAWFARDCC